VGAFVDGVTEGRLEDAVRLYAGPFLDGFFLRGAPEFDPWVEGERARLAALFGGALEQLAREATARGDVPAATALWKRLGFHAPYSSRVTLEVVRALDRAGDRTGALRRARAHCALVTSDLGAEPDAEILQMAARLASAVRVPPAPDGAPASRRRSPAPTRR
jgi:DNA-binding SARP family transcriptional activator